MASSRNHCSHAVLPMDIWAMIIQHCPKDAIMSLAVVSEDIQDESLRSLYRRVFYIENTLNNQPNDFLGTRVYDLDRFLHALIRRPQALLYIRHASFSWNHGVQFNGYHIPTTKTKKQEEFERGIEKVVRVLSKADRLVQLHLSLPDMFSDLPLKLQGITSLTIPVTCYYHPTNVHSQLLKLLQLQSLVSIEVVTMLQVNAEMPADILQPGTSNIRHLALTKCGPVHASFSRILSWPKDLRTLDLDIGTTFSTPAIDGPDGISFPGIRDALQPLENSLERLNIRIISEDSMLDVPLQDKAFSSFRKLREVYLPLKMLMRFSEAHGVPLAYDVAPSIHTQIPSSLEVLTLKVLGDFSWYERCLPTNVVPCRQVRELFAWLSGLARHKRDFPHLHTVRVSRHNGVPKSGHSLADDYTRDFMSLMQNSGINVEFI